MPSTPAQRRYNRDALILCAAYSALLVLAIGLFKNHAPAGPLAYVVALLPALPIVGLFAAIGRYLVTERDEYLRLLMVRQVLVASALALSLATAWGFLESFGVAPRIDAYYIAVVWFGGLGLGNCINRLVERRA